MRIDDRIYARSETADQLIANQMEGQISIKIYVPQDTTAVALGADQIANRLEEVCAGIKLSVEIVREWL